LSGNVARAEKVTTVCGVARERGFGRGVKKEGKRRVGVGSGAGGGR